MSFVSVLKKIEGVALGIEPVVAPIAEVAFPQFAGPIAAVDSLFHRLQSGVAASQAANPAGEFDPSSAAKDFDMALEVIDGFLAPGQSVFYDPKALNAAIVASAAAFKAYADLKATFKIIGPSVPGSVPIGIALKAT